MKTVYNLYEKPNLTTFALSIEITLYYSDWIYFAFIIKSYFALLTYLQYYISLHVMYTINLI